MKKMNIAQNLYQIGAMAVVRTPSFERACEIAEGLISGGVPSMEMSYTLNNAGEIIRKLKSKYGDKLLVGAGTILDSETARHAVLHDADFIISATFNKGVAEICNRYQIPYAAGCTTYTEAIEALTAGASFIKAFPISNFYGPELVNIFKTPFPQMPILASGGINLNNIEVWLENGIEICGIGSLLTKGSSEMIAENARLIAGIIKKYR